MRITNGSRYRMGELGAEAFCSRCGEWWPADEEFYYRQSDGKPHSWCKACYEEARKARRQASREETRPAATGTTA